MSNIPYLYTLFVLTGCVLALIAVWSRRSLWIRIGATLALIALVALDYFALVDLLSKPRPMALAALVGEAPNQQSTVLAASVEEGKAIYLWLRLEHEPAPRYYSLPWDLDLATELQKAIIQADENHTAIMMRPPFESSLDDRDQPLFYALPQPRLPLKPPPNLNEYRHPSLTL